MTPVNWPSGWAFPVKHGAWPPGYPQAFPADVFMRYTWSKGLLVVWFVDEFEQPTEALNGQFMEIQALKDDKVVGVRDVPGGKWTKHLLLPIGKCCKGFGVVDSVETKEPAQIVVRVYGFNKEVTL